MQGNKGSSESAEKRRKIDENIAAQQAPHVLQVEINDFSILISALQELSNLINNAEFNSPKARALHQASIMYLSDPSNYNPLVELASMEISDEELTKKLDVLFFTEMNFKRNLLLFCQEEFANPVAELIFYADQQIGEFSTKQVNVLFILNYLKEKLEHHSFMALVQALPTSFKHVEGAVAGSALSHALDRGLSEIVEFFISSGVASSAKLKFMVQRTDAPTELRTVSLVEYLLLSRNKEMLLLVLNNPAFEFKINDEIAVIKFKKQNPTDALVEFLQPRFSHEYVENYLLQKAIHENSIADFLELFEDDLYALTQDIWEKEIINYIKFSRNEKLKEVFEKFQKIYNSQETSALVNCLKQLTIASPQMQEAALTKLGTFLQECKAAQKKIYLNFRDAEKRNLILIVSAFNKPELVSLLLELGVNPNLANNIGATPLYIACLQGHEKVVTTLLNNQNVNPNLANNIGATPLYIACLQGHEKVVTTLLNNQNVNPNLAEKNGWTPLLIACHNGHEKIVTALLSNQNVNPNLGNNNGSTPLYIACQQGHEKVVTALLSNPKVAPNLAANSRKTPLLIACHNGHEKIVTALLNNPNVNPNLANNDGWTPLLIACAKGHEKVVTLLLKNEKINLKSQSKNGSEALQFAAQGGNLEIVNLLLERELYDVNHVNSDGQNALYYAVRSLNKEVVERFIKLGLNPTLVGNDGTTIKDFLANEINSPKDPVKLAQANEIKRMIDVYTEKYLAVRSNLGEHLSILPNELANEIHAHDSLSLLATTSIESKNYDTSIEHAKDVATAHILQKNTPKPPVLKVIFNRS